MMTYFSEAYQSTCPRCGMDFINPDNVRLEVCQVCDAEITRQYMRDNDNIGLYVTFKDYRNKIDYVGNWLGSLKFLSPKIVKHTNFTHTIYYGERKSKWTIRTQRNITIEFIDEYNQTWRGTLFNADWNMSAKFRRV